MEIEKEDRLIKRDEKGFIYTPLTKKALKISFQQHKDQLDKAGYPYIYHPFYLATRMDDEYSTCVALLHDVIEDTDMTIEDLEKEFPKEVVDAVNVLTRDKNRYPNYLDYIKSIKSNPLALKVKLEDLKHNSTLERLDNITQSDIDRVNNKYVTALKILKEKN